MLGRLLPALLLLAALSGCDGCGEPQEKKPAGEEQGEQTQYPTTPAGLVEDLFSENQQRREYARTALIGMRHPALPHLLQAVKQRGLARSGEIISVMVELGRLHVPVGRIFRNWLVASFPPQKLALLRDPSSNSGGSTEDLAKTLVELVVALIDLGQRRTIPEELRVFYNARVLRDLARDGRGASLSAQESAGELLELGARSVADVVRNLNHKSDDVAQHFSAVAYHLHRKQVVQQILELLAREPARNLWIYTTLSYLTMHEVWLHDLGFERPAPEVFASRRDKLLAQWHPVFLSRWQAWWKTHGAESLEEWWIEGFRRAGHPIASTRSLEDVPRLIEALKNDSHVVRACALSVLRRNTFHNLSFATYLTHLELFPGRQAPDEQTMLTLAVQHWSAWWRRHAKRPRRELARAEADQALSTLLAYGRDARNTDARLLRVLYAADLFLRKLTGNTLPEIPWTGDFRHGRQKRRILSGLRELVDRRFADARFRESLEQAPWWY